MSQSEIEKFLKERIGERFTCREIHLNLKEKGLFDGSLKALQHALKQLCKYNKISSDTCILRCEDGRDTLSKIYYYSFDELQISPIVHIEKLPLKYIKKI